MTTVCTMSKMSNMTAITANKVLIAIKAMCTMTAMIVRLL